MLKTTNTLTAANEVWWQRMHTESGLKTVLKMGQFKELFQFIADEALDRAVKANTQYEDHQQLGEETRFAALCRILGSTTISSADDWNRMSGYMSEIEMERYVRQSNALIVRGISIDFMHALFMRSVFRSKVPFSGICAEICLALPVDERWNEASTDEYQSLDSEGISTEKLRTLYDASLFDVELSLPALYAEIDEVRSVSSLT